MCIKYHWGENVQKLIERFQECRGLAGADVQDGLRSLFVEFLHYWVAFTRSLLASQQYHLPGLTSRGFTVDAVPSISDIHHNEWQ